MYACRVCSARGRRQINERSFTYGFGIAENALDGENLNACFQKTDGSALIVAPRCESTTIVHGSAAFLGLGELKIAN